MDRCFSVWTNTIWRQLPRVYLGYFGVLATNQYIIQISQRTRCMRFWKWGMDRMGQNDSFPTPKHGCLRILKRTERVSGSVVVPGLTDWRSVGLFRADINVQSWASSKRKMGFVMICQQKLWDVFRYELATCSVLLFEHSHVSRFWAANSLLVKRRWDYQQVRNN